MIAPLQTIARLLITGRDALVKIQDKMAAKQAASVPFNRHVLCTAFCVPSYTRAQSLVAAAEASRNKGKQLRAM
jgi:hypothetical protein